MKKLLLAIVFILCSATMAWAPTSVTFMWDPPSNVTNITGYKVYRSTTAGTYVKTSANLVCTVPVGTNACTEAAHPDGTWFWVAVSYNASGESGNSNEITRTLGPPSSPPTGLRIQTN